MRSLGIDVGSFSVKVAELEISPRGLEIRNLAEYPLSQDPNHDRKLELFEKLSQIGGRYRDSEIRIALAVRQDHVSLRRRTFPFRERGKILRSLPFELEDEIPLAAEDAIFDMRVLQYRGTETDVLAFASPKERIATVLKTARDAGLDPAVITVTGAAQGNLFGSWTLLPPQLPAAETEEDEAPEIESTRVFAAGQAKVIVDIGHTHTTILLLRGSQCLDIRSIDWGGSDLAQTLSRRYTIPYKEALKELREKAFLLINPEGASQVQIALSDALKEEVRQLGRRLNLVLMELKSEHKLEIEGAEIMGGVAHLKNLAPFLTQLLEVPVNPLRRLEHFPAIDLSEPKNLVYLTAIALGLEGLRRPQNPPVNLLRGEFAREGLEFQAFLQKWSPALTAAGIAFLVLMVWTYWREHQATNLTEDVYAVLDEKARGIPGRPKRGGGDPITAIEGFIRKQDKEVRLLADLASVQEYNSALSVLKTISQIAPARPYQLSVKRLLVRGPDVEIEGEVGPTSDPKLFEKQLREISQTKDFKPYQSPHTPTPGWRPFGYRFQVNRRGGGRE